ncbi:MAG: GHKL domain-containing protein [Lachnospiraceae bacterium]|nr:GHKL domain-containing protein [Ruminococcus sp.]MCM1276868.1 GHKL domain-containing protein [Lachnospiraceae bacterium]
MIDFIEILASLAECFIIVRLSNRFLGFKNENLKWLKSTCLFVLLAFTDVILSRFSIFKNIYEIFILLILLMYSLVFLNGKIQEKILLTAIPITTAMPINLIIINAFRAASEDPVTELTEPGGALRIPILFFTKFAFFIVCEMLVRLLKRNRRTLNGFQWIIQLSCFIISFLITNSLWSISLRHKDMRLDFLFAYIMIALLNILLYLLLNKMQNYNTIREEYNLLQANISAREKLVMEARTRYSEIKTLRHDIKHYLSTVAGLISNGKPEKAKEYIESIIEKKITPTAIGVDTGSAVIDAVINDSLSRCAEEGITTKCLIDTQFISENDIDVSILLSNLLDNAVSGCKGIDSPVIELSITNKKSLTQIVVSNSISESVLNNNPDLETSKIDKSLHGAEQT